MARFQLPFQLARQVGPVGLDCEFGALASTAGRSEFLYGIVAGTKVAKQTQLMLELHATSRTNFTREVITANVGWRYELNEHAIWIASVGHEVRSADSPRALIGYCGVQLVY